jgi:hypothetical protein
MQTINAEKILRKCKNRDLSDTMIEIIHDFRGHPQIHPKICSKSSKCQTHSLIWVVDQDQLNPYVAYEGYVARVPHNPLFSLQIN